jgi:AraC-like DNA-binding protein
MSTPEGLRLQVEGGLASIVLEEPEEGIEVRDVITMTRLVGLWRLGESLSGKELRATTEVSFAEPPYFAQFAGFAPPIRFGCARTRVVLDAAMLDLPLVTADPVSLRLATEQCARELAAIGSAGRLVRDVRGQIWRGDGSLRSPAEVAKAMHVSPRTLRRKLETEGRSLSSLFDEERRDRAALLLREPGLSLSQVAERLGYRKVQSFERAFRRWTGTTPAAYRKT